LEVEPTEGTSKTLFGFIVTEEGRFWVIQTIDRIIVVRKCWNSVQLLQHVSVGDIVEVINFRMYNNYLNFTLDSFVIILYRIIDQNGKSRI
jgi:hypothetical protein